MKYLFIDYDQGAGGEYFCQCISSAPECNKLEYFVTQQDRVKINDIFKQEFLKPLPNPIVPTTTVGNNEKYHVVPTHRHTALAKTLLLDSVVKSVRIQSPVDSTYFKYFKTQQLNKVLLVSEPTDAMFVGFLRILVEQTNNKTFLKRVKRDMDNLSLTLLSNNIEPSEEARNNYINELFNNIIPEPEFDYDVTIPYEALFTSPQQIVDVLYQQLGVQVDLKLLTRYQQKFNNAQNTKT